MTRAGTLFLLGTMLVTAGYGPQAAAAELEHERLKLQLKEDASIELRDVQGGVVWRIAPPTVVLRDGSRVAVTMDGPVSTSSDQLRYRSADGTSFTLRLVETGPAIDYSFEPSDECTEVHLLDHSLPLGPGNENYYAVPHRMGIMLRADGDGPYSRRFRGYETGSGYSMAMFGAVQDGAALLLSWSDPYTDIAVDYVTEPSRQLSMGLQLRNSARLVRIQPIGKGGYVELAKAYRKIARQRGHLVTLAEKAERNPKITKMFGAADFKPFAYMQLAPNTRWNQSNERGVSLRFTFEECAQLAEHFHGQLGIDKAMLILNGWINGGYDNKHPDVLPAAEAIGGNAGLVQCAERTKALGWLFGLHDNYADMYRDAPSWDESYLMRRSDGTIRPGGVWAGGQCWLICSQKAKELASRPQNVPGVIQLCDPDIYFSDVIFATPLYECFSEDHPLTMVEDMAAKKQLCDYIRDAVGLFGSEEGREWGVPHADYFEGLMSHRTRWRRPDDTSIILPLFELVFGDAILMYTHQSDRPQPNMPKYILGHILYAEMPVYYFGEHRYYQEPVDDFQPRDDDADQLLYARGGRFCLIDQFIKNTYEILSPLNRITALMPMTDHRFLDTGRTVEWTRFGEDVEIVVNFGRQDFDWRGTRLPENGFVVSSPSLVAFCAVRHDSVDYSEPTLFVIWARDGAAIDQSKDVQIYHGFGDSTLRFRGELKQVSGDMLKVRSEP